jgi:hypothetical protein
MAIWMALEHYLNGSQFLGLELLLGPWLGGVFGVLEGTAIGAVWAFIARGPRRMTIGRLMLGVAILGPMSAFLPVLPWRLLVVLALTLVVILMPAIMGISAAIEVRQEEERRIGQTNHRQYSLGNQSGQLTDLLVRFSNWDDTSLANRPVERKV